MKLKNTTDFSDRFLRRMTAWCCKQIGYPIRELKVAQFRNKESGYRGFARYWSKMISATIPGSNCFPMGPDNRPGMQGERFNDRLECLVAITAHEIFHLAAHYVDEHKQRTRHSDGTHGSSEQATRREEVRVLRLFRESRSALLEVWNAADEVKPKKSIQEQRFEKVQKALCNWQRKLKLAQTKVKQYRRKAKYYEGTTAAKSQE